MELLQRIVIVDDDPDLSESVADYFVAHGLAASTARDGAELRQMVLDPVRDVVLLDLQLPGETGFCLLDWLAARYPGLLVLVLSGRQDSASRVRALEAGAVDYVIKPFDLRELTLRLQRLGWEGARSAAHTLGEWRIDVERRLASTAEGLELVLTLGEARLLEVLLRARGKVVDRRRLASAASDRHAGGSLDTVAVLIHRLRQKLEADPARPRLIQTVPGAGYRVS